MDTEKGLADSESVATLVDKNLNLTISTKTLLDNLTVTVPTNTEILQFSYSSPKATQAQQLAQGFADAYLQFRKDAAVAQVRGQPAAPTAARQAYRRTPATPRRSDLPDHRSRDPPEAAVAVK